MASSPCRGSEEVDEVVSAGWVIPVDTDAVLADHSVAIRGGKIVGVLPTADAIAKYKTNNYTSLPNSALMPGFVNTHNHSPMVYLRGVSDDVNLRDWLEKTIWPLEFKFCGPEFVRDGCELAVAEMIMGGTTTFNDMYWFPESVCEVVKSSGIRAAVGIIAIEFPFGSYGTGPDDYLEKGQKTRELFAGESRISWTVSLHAPYTCSDATLAKGKELSDKLNVPLHIHLHETQAEVEDSITQTASMSKHMSEEKCSPLKNMKRLGMVNERLVAVHMNWLTDEEISDLAQAKSNVVHCPASGLKLGSGMCRTADLLQAGVNVALGTDGASSNNTLDMMAEMRLAALLAKGVRKDSTVAPAMVALRMATLSGAKALGIDSVTGSLSVGKEADMISVDFGSPSAWPAPTVTDSAKGFDAVTHIVYASTRDQVSNVWVQGKCLMKDRKLLCMQVDELWRKAQEWGAKITEAKTGMASPPS